MVGSRGFRHARNPRHLRPGIFEELQALLLGIPFLVGVKAEEEQVLGIEAGLDYESDPFRAYANVARGEQKAKQITSNQFFFDQQELGYISNHYIFTDHSQTWTASAGAALKLKNRFGSFEPGLDLIFGSGLRAGDPAGIVPNGGKQDGYVQVNLGLAQRFGGEEHGFTVRLDVVNLFDQHYLIHDGSGVGAGQPEYGPRRGFFFGLRKSF